MICQNILVKTEQASDKHHDNSIVQSNPQEQQGLHLPAVSSSSTLQPIVSLPGCSSSKRKPIGLRNHWTSHFFTAVFTRPLERRPRMNHLTLFSKVEIPRKKQRPSAHWAERGATFNVHNKPKSSLSRALFTLGTQRTPSLPAELTAAACSVFPCYRYGGDGPLNGWHRQWHVTWTPWGDSHCRLLSLSFFCIERGDNAFPPLPCGQLFTP